MGIQILPGESYEDFLKRDAATNELKRKTERERALKQKLESPQLKRREARTLPPPSRSSELEALSHFAKRKWRFDLEAERRVIEEEKTEEEEELKKILEADRELTIKAIKRVKKIFYETFMPCLDGEKVQWNKRLSCKHSTIAGYMERCYDWRETENIAAKVRNGTELSVSQIVEMLIEETPSEITLGCDFYNGRLINPRERGCGASYNLRLIPKLK